jgi:hypothetical protein
MKIRASVKLTNKLLVALVSLGLSLVYALVDRAEAQNNLIDFRQRTMVNPIRAFVVYWLPPGVVLDTGIPGGTGNFDTLIQRFLSDISGDAYFHIITQYPGTTCLGPTCFVQNVGGAVALGGSWVDTQAYPHPGTNNDAGTRANPLLDSDIQNEVTRAVNQNNWTVDNNSIFFVITGVFNNGVPVEECHGINCTFKGIPFCAYHNTFLLGGNTLIYSYLSDASFSSAGCLEGLSTTGTTGPNGQIASDRQVALMSHELLEAVTDPDLDTWYDPPTGNEIGDNCNQMPSIVSLNDHSYAVQKMWSNASSSCVDGLFDLVPLYYLLLP